MTKSVYIHGTAPEEQERLALLNHITNPAFLTYLDPRPNERVLEVGSGLGLLAREVATRTPQGSVVGIEFSEAQLARARAEKRPNLSFAQGDAHRLPFPDGQFDLVYARYVLEHLAEPTRALSEMWRVLRPGGRICVQENNILINVFDPDCPAFDSVWRKFAVLQGLLGGDAQIGKRLFRLLREVGFGRIELDLAPEVHWSGSPHFRGWIRNLIGNVESGAQALMERGLATEVELYTALQELEALVENPEGSAIFYWNRARAVKA